jgi:WD40 repeat protein
VQFSYQEGLIISVAAEKALFIIDAVAGTITECQLNNNGPKTTHCSTCWDEKGRCYSGGSNGLIYIWENGVCTSTVQIHEEGFVCALKYSNGKIASGGKAGTVNIWDPDTLEVSAQVNFGVLVRAVDITENLCLVGLRDGSIKFFPLDNLEDMDTLMESHADGEVWGLDVFEDGNIMTSADDNNHMIIDTKEHSLIDEALITEEQVHGNGPVTMSAWPTSQQSRAVAVNG